MTIVLTARDLTRYYSVSRGAFANPALLKALESRVAAQEVDGTGTEEVVQIGDRGRRQICSGHHRAFLRLIANLSGQRWSDYRTAAAVACVIGSPQFRRSRRVDRSRHFPLTCVAGLW